MQRRVEQPDDDRQALHHVEQRRELAQGEVLDLRQGARRGRRRVTTTLDELAPRAEQHVLGAAEADALSAVSPCGAGLLGDLGIGENLETTAPVSVRQQPEHRVDHGVGVRRRSHSGSRSRRRSARSSRWPSKMLAGRAVDGQQCPLAEDCARRGRSRPVPRRRRPDLDAGHAGACRGRARPPPRARSARRGR